MFKHFGRMAKKQIEIYVITVKLNASNLCLERNNGPEIIQIYTKNE